MRVGSGKYHAAAAARRPPTSTSSWSEVISPSLPPHSPRPGERGSRHLRRAYSANHSLFSRPGGVRWEKRAGVMRGPLPLDQLRLVLIDQGVRHQILPLGLLLGGVGGLSGDGLHLLRHPFGSEALVLRLLLDL